MTEQTDDGARRAYWTEQMDRGYDLVDQLLTFPVDECYESFAPIPDAAEAAGVEIQFSDSKIAGDLDRVFFLRRSLVDDVVAIGRDMNERGWILKIEDGFRSLAMQRALVRKPEVFDAILQKCIWEVGGVVPSVEFVFRRAIVMVANIPKIGTHMSGSAIDISVLRRDDHSEVWRGGPYLQVDEKTPMLSPFITEEERHTRIEITAILESHGLVHFPFEYWHYNKHDACAHVLTGKSEPARYGPVNWNPESNEVSHVDDQLQPLHPLEGIEQEIDAAMKRR